MTEEDIPISASGFHMCLHRSTPIHICIYTGAHLYMHFLYRSIPVHTFVYTGACLYIYGSTQGTLYIYTQKFRSRVLTVSL